MRITGRCMVLGDNINTDIVYPGRHLSILDWKEQARYAFENLGPEMPAKVASHPVIVAGRNFGCGSSREHAATALLGAGTQAVVAKSFSRIFFRNCVNNGLAVIQSEELPDLVADGDTLTADLAAGKAEVGGRTVAFDPLPQSLLDILRHGGLWGRWKAQKAS